MSRPRRDQDRYGLVCPSCGARTLRVVYTREAWGNVINRRRECRECRARVTTRESAAFWHEPQSVIGRESASQSTGGGPT